jgi:hypothetical protein
MLNPPKINAYLMINFSIIAMTMAIEFFRTDKPVALTGSLIAHIGLPAIQWEWLDQKEEAIND